MTLRQARCWLLGGHMPVTRRAEGVLCERCFLCDAPLGSGWNFADLARRLRERRAARRDDRPRRWRSAA